MTVSSRVLDRWYGQLAMSLEAGLSLERAVATIAGPPANVRNQLQQRLLAGETIAEALDHGAPWLPHVDRELIVAAANVGRLPDMLRRLASRHAETVRGRRAALAAAAYPVFVAHFAVVVFPVSLLFSGGGLSAYAWAVAKLLAPLWALAALMIWAIRKRLRPVAAVLDLVPLLGGYRKFRAIADLAFVLEAQVSAGMRFDVAWLQAAIAAGDRRLEPVAMDVAAAVQRGELVSPILAGRRELPDPFCEFYANGERTGRLDESLAFLHRHFRDLAGRRLALASLVYPKLLFAAVAVWVAFQVIRFYAGYFQQIDQLM